MYIAHHIQPVPFTEWSVAAIRPAFQQLFRSIRKVLWLNLSQEALTIDALSNAQDLIELERIQTSL
jgi:hypothetical protein